MEQKLIDTIQKMSYTKFVAFVNQWNVPPGSLATVNEWSVFGHVNRTSKVLEIACTTGFSGRELSRITGCAVTGIDICEDSISAARLSQTTYGKTLELNYINADACGYNFGQKFTHVVLGASLGFFKNPDVMLEQLKNYFDESGYILASPYYGCADMPEALKNECRRVIGIDPTVMSYDAIRDVYQNFEVAYESRKKIELETSKQMKKYTEDTIQSCCRTRGITSTEIYRVLFDRLYEIKNVSNELHRYQSYSVMVLRYLNTVYPNRFIELF